MRLASRFLATAAAVLVTAAVRAESRMPLAPESAVAAAVASFSLEAPGSGRVPNYLRAMAASRPAAAAPLARLVKTMLFGGTVPPDVKIAMGRKIAALTNCGYVDAHLRRLQTTSEEKENTEQQALAVRFANDLTRAVHGVDVAEFARLRGAFNDAEIVELTMTTCFFNFFTRLCAGLNLEKETWLGESPAAPTSLAANPFVDARVTLLTDPEIIGVTELAKSGTSSGLGIGIPNSRRAMVRVPDMADAWFGYWQSVRQDETVPRTTLLQVSLAVSTLNGCRYCTLHQVVGLRKQGVDIAKLLDLKKSDDALSPSEKAAVTFARKLSTTPPAVGDADFAALQREFPGEKAMSVLLQTCAFAFMNRFTDGLRLPSEDEAVHTYHEVYGKDHAAIPR